MDGVIKLLKSTITKDALGYPVESTTEREVLCDVDSITRAEFFQAGKAGLTPEHLFRVNAAEYDGESEAEYLGKRFRIYRTYLPDMSEFIELYAEYRSGVTDAGQDQPGPAPDSGPANA